MGYLPVGVRRAWPFPLHSLIDVSSSRFALTGTGSYDYGTGLFSIVADVSDSKPGSLTYSRNYEDGGIFVVGEYGGEMIDLQE